MMMMLTRLQVDHADLTAQVARVVRVVRVCLVCLADADMLLYILLVLRRLLLGSAQRNGECIFFQLSFKKRECCSINRISR